jgi:hypothetical protein
MALWDKGTEEITCRHCGARHLADYREYLLSNIGSQGCLKCRKELISWKGPRDYIHRIQIRDGTIASKEPHLRLSIW